MSVVFPRRALGALALTALAALAACSDSVGAPSVAFDQQFSFEHDLEGWTTHAIDVGDGTGATAEWTIERSRDRADAGAWSVKMYQNNYTDAAKIWMARDLTLEPNTAYTTTVSFRFATRDFGDINHFRVIAGAFAPRAGKPDDIPSLIRDETGNGSARDAGYVWLTKSYTATATTDSAGTLRAVVGVWGTHEVAKTYYVDRVRVLVQRR